MAKGFPDWKRDESLDLGAEKLILKPGKLKRKKIHKNQLYVFICSGQSGSETKKIPFTIVSRRIKYLGFNKKCKTYTSPLNCKTSLKERILVNGKILHVDGSENLKMLR